MALSREPPSGSHRLALIQIQPEENVESYYDDEEECEDVGARCNRWRRPFYEIGYEDRDIVRNIRLNKYMSSLNFGKTFFDKAAQIVDFVLDLLLKYLKSGSRPFKGLTVENYIRQGSSRDGLKVDAPDEFDALLQFRIEGLNFQAVCLQNEKGESITELGEIHLLDSWPELQRSYPGLCGMRVFENLDGKCLVNSRNIYEKIFVSLIDKAVSKLSAQPQICLEGTGYNCKFKRINNPPSVKITVELYKVTSQSKDYTPCHFEIDIDVVPGILVGTDRAADLSDPFGYIECPRHYVIKYKTPDQKANKALERPAHLWRICTSGYDLYLLDVSRYYINRRYIFTALRIWKTYLIGAKHLPHTSISISNLKYKSFYIKQIAFYCVQYLCVEESIPLAGVKEAMGYIFDLLQVSLEEGRLPHFFHSNPSLKKLLPFYDTHDRCLSFDLYQSLSPTSLKHAVRSMNRDVPVHLHELLVPGRHSVHVREKFRQHIRTRKYYQSNETRKVMTKKERLRSSVYY